MASQVVKLIVVVCLVMIICTACKPQIAGVSPAMTDNHTENPQHTIASTVNPKPSQASGSIVSKELVQVADQNPNIRIYKVFYMSEGAKVEAYLSEPIAPGKYPLLVELHGGWAFQKPAITHDKSVGFHADLLKYASDSVIIFAPNYRGYMDSEGAVQGLAGDTLDTQNAIKAAMSLGIVKPDSLYLRGLSTGGGVALRTASERHDVKAVIAVSPFVGWDEIIHWLDNNPNDSDSYSPVVISERNNAKVIKDFFDMHPGTEKDNSLLDRIPDIQAPVLFLQGTGDESVIWQTVQEFANEMKIANKTVKFVLYPDGAHGLHDKYQQDSNNETINWLIEYGLPTPYHRPLQ
jgi:dipeptidyl aminopeptidase/acylaminoacyl peptidase